MQTREIAKDDWHSFFDQVSRALRGKLIQIEANKLSLNGLTYDSKDDALIITSDQIEHVIRSPLQIFITDGGEGINSLKVCAADGTDQIVNFTEPLALPSAG